ncbi:MAG: hypothetical protein AAB555_01475 [Patescibacteria group bacterium]
MAKTAVMREQMTTSQNIWDTFKKAHPVPESMNRNFGLRGVLSGTIALLTYSVVGMHAVYSASDSDTIGNLILLTIFLFILVGTMLFYILVKRPSNAINLHRIAVRNAFILRHKAEAEILGFEMYRE